MTRGGKAVAPGSGTLRRWLGRYALVRSRAAAGGFDGIGSGTQRLLAATVAELER